MEGQVECTALRDRAFHKLKRVANVAGHMTRKILCVHLIHTIYTAETVRVIC